MPCVQVAPLAEERKLRHEHLVVVRAVGVVAVQAVLANRRVLPEKRPALLRVAGQALLVDPLGRDHLRFRRVVRVMAIRARHLSFAHRMVRRPQAFRAHCGVAGKARLAVPGGLQLCLDGFEVVDAVAGDASEVLAIVNAPHPVRLPSLLVTRQTLLVDVGRRHLLEGDDGSHLALFRLRLQMIRDVSVAVFANARNLHVFRVLERGERLLVARLAVVDVELQSVLGRWRRDRCRWRGRLSPDGVRRQRHRHQRKEPEETSAHAFLPSRRTLSQGDRCLRSRRDVIRRTSRVPLIVAPSRGRVSDAVSSSTIGRLFDDVHVIAENIVAEPRELRVRELVPTVTGPGRQRLRVARERDPAMDLLGELPQIRILLHLRAREMGASPDVLPPPAIELRFVPSTKTVAEDTALGGHLTE